MKKQTPTQDMDTTQDSITLLYNLQKEKRKNIDKVYTLIYTIVSIYLFSFFILFKYFKAYLIISLISVGVISFITLIIIFKNKLQEDIEEIDSFYLKNS